MDRRRRIPAIVQAVDVGNRHLGQRLVRDVLEAAEIHAVHLADRRVVAHAKGTHATAPAEVVLVPLAAEKILRQLIPAAEEAEAVGPRHCRPEARAPADRAIAAKGWLREIELRLEVHRAAMAGATISLQHGGHLTRQRTGEYCLRWRAAAVAPAAETSSALGRGQRLGRREALDRTDQLVGGHGFLQAGYAELAG